MLSNQQRYGSLRFSYLTDTTFKQPMLMPHLLQSILSTKEKTIQTSGLNFKDSPHLQTAKQKNIYIYIAAEESDSKDPMMYT